MIFNIKSVLIGLVLSQTMSLAFGQNQKSEKYYSNSDRHWLAELPIWVPGFRGQLAVASFDLTSSGTNEEKEFSRINGDPRLEFYLVGRVAVQYNKFWAQFDAFSGEVGSTFTYTSDIGNKTKQLVDVKVQGTIPRLVAG